MIGVVAGGRSRAYLVRAFCRGPASHIVNDVLGGTAVSVTYCDQRDCACVFAGEGAEPLDLRQGGLQAGQMTLRAAGVRYGQESLSPEDAEGAPPFPYVAHAFERTTWGAWRGAHPGTEVYLGPPPGS